MADKGPTKVHDEIVVSSDDDSEGGKSSATHISYSNPDEPSSSECKPVKFDTPLATSAEESFDRAEGQFCKSTWNGGEPKAPGSYNELDESLEVLEICGGCARLTLHSKNIGLNALGIDWKGCKDKPEGRVIWLDLTTERGMTELKAILEANKK